MTPEGNTSEKLDEHRHEILIVIADLRRLGGVKDMSSSPLWKRRQKSEAQSIYVHLALTHGSIAMELQRFPEICDTNGCESSPVLSFRSTQRLQKMGVSNHRSSAPSNNQTWRTGESPFESDVFWRFSQSPMFAYRTISHEPI